MRDGWSGVAFGPCIYIFESSIFSIVIRCEKANGALMSSDRNLSAAAPWAFTKGLKVKGRIETVVNEMLGNSAPVLPTIRNGSDMARSSAWRCAHAHHDTRMSRGRRFGHRLLRGIACMTFPDHCLHFRAFFDQYEPAAGGASPAPRPEFRHQGPLDLF